MGNTHTEPNSAMLAYTAPKPKQTMIKFQKRPPVPPFTKLRLRELEKKISSCSARE